MEEFRIAFKKIQYDTGEEIFKIKVQSPDGANDSNWICMRRDFNDTVNILRRKYGIGKSQQHKDKDMDWLR